ncbi:capsule biosynthesis protein CapK [Sorangium cellulosum]|uniref:Capsule biosynthesis protein CapK n=1 Tax=Sorangium cellulosum TaxID=56 RepID=A0A150SV15_SORCE|nr:capsule biosynthesis protein CapK [Sorangium cellulosum]KYF96128.1 capsule biosynthesis protein CapK [Sorangium cellulosum]
MYGELFRNILFPLYETRLRGRETLKHLEDLERSQWLSEDEIRDLGFRRMLAALHFAEQNVPFYRARFAEHGVRVASVKAPEDLVRLPVLTRADLRAHGPELLAEGFVGKLYSSGTGGSTGEPVRFRFDHRTYERRVAAAMRSDGWAGARLGDRELHLWSTQFGETLAKKAKRSLHEAILRKKMVSAFDLSEARFAALLDEIARYRPQLIVGYTSALYHAARYALAEGRALPPPRGVVTSAERLFAHQREAIERAFGAPVFDRYGCRELMLIAAECERHEGKHIHMEGVYVELLRDGRHALPGEPGEVVVTDLVCRSMPLIRYKNQDVAIAAGAPCACGRGLPMLASVEGRVLDLLVGPDGQLLAGELFPHLIKDQPTIARYQVYQDRRRAITVRLVPAKGFQPETARLIERTVRQHLGERAEICVQIVDRIPLTPGGKHRVTVSEVPVELSRRPAA